MAYASQSGRARVSSTNPEAFGVCDRCGIWHNSNDLSWQFQWLGSTLQNIRILVCSECLDVPQEQLRAITLPADPIPIINARPENFQADSTDYIGTGQATINPQTGIPMPSNNVLGGATVNDIIIPQPIGPNLRPNSQGKLIPSVLGVDPNAQMTPVMDTQWAKRLSITSIVANATPIISINCSSPHGLSSGGQVAIWGTTNPLAYGIFTVTVTSATVFTVQANAAVPTGTISTTETIVVTTNAGLPWSVTQVPQTGI